MDVFRPGSKEDVMSRHISGRAERRFSKGDDHFIARSFITSAFIIAMQREKNIIANANERIVRSFADLGAEAEVYAVETDLGNGREHSTDFVNVIARNGIRTGAQRTPLHSDAESYVIRASTADIDR